MGPDDKLAPMRLAPLVSCVVVAAALAAARGLPRLTFDHDTRSLLRADADADAVEQELRAVFGAEDILLIAWSADVLAPETFALLVALTTELETVPGLEELYSLASPQVKFSIRGQLRALQAEDLETDEGQALARAALRSAPVYLKTIYNDELDTVAIAGSIAPGPASARWETLRQVRAVVVGMEPKGVTLHVAGVTAFQMDAVAYSIVDLKRIGTWATSIALIVLWFLCRSWRATLAAVLATALPPLLALGFAAWFAIPITALATALFPVLVVVGVTSTVHLLHAYSEDRASGLDHARAAHGAARRLAAPVTLSLLTTAAAFASLQLTGVPAFRRAGPLVAAGLLSAIPVLLIFFPAVLARWRPPGVRRGTPRLAHLFSLRRAPLLWAIGALLVAVSCAFKIRSAQVEVNALQAFQPDSEIARTYRYLEDRLTAAVPVDLILHADEQSDVAAVLHDLRTFARAAAAIDEVDSTLSLETLVDYGKTVSPLPVGDTGALVFLRTFFPEITRRFEHVPTRRYRVKVRVREAAPPRVLDEIAAAATKTKSGRAELTGLYVRAVSTTRHLLRDVARGTLWMVALVGLVVTLALRSWRLGLVSLLPNLLPPLLVGAGAVVLDIGFDVAVVAVGAVAVGLAVDDSFHVLFRYRRERLAGSDVRTALEATVRGVGPALSVSTTVLVAGLCCLAMSSFLPTARFGLFCAAASAVALPADLWLLPALVRLAFPDRMKR